MIALGMASGLMAQDPVMLLKTKTVSGSGDPLDSIVYEYDNNLNLVAETRMYYSIKSLEWKNSWKLEYVYDASGVLESIVRYAYGGTEWAKTKRTQYIYNPDGQTKKEIVESWDNSNWNQSESITYFYNDNNELDSTHRNNDDGAGNVSPKERSDYWIDDEGRVIGIVTHRLKDGSFEQASRTDYLYEDGKLVKEDNYSWINYWYHSDYFVYSYTSFDEVAKRERYIHSTGELNDTKYYTYNKEDENSSIKPQSNFARLEVYPNPFTNQLRFDVEAGVYKLSVYNLVGTNVMVDSEITGETTLDASNWKRGIYVYQLTDTQSGAIQTGKILAK